MSIQEDFSSAIGLDRGASAATSLCQACVTLLAVDAAAISLVFDGANAGTLGASSVAARNYDELQFTFGEGPCLDSVAGRSPVLVADLAETTLSRWPGYSAAMLALDIRSVYAMPVVLAGEYVGALDLFRRGPSRITAEHLEGALVAAIMAEMPLLDLLEDDPQVSLIEVGSDAWAELSALTRIEVSQATGMLIEQLDVDATEALVRLRAHAYATNRTATDVARDIIDHGLRLDHDT